MCVGSMSDSVVIIQEKSEVWFFKQHIKLFANQLKFIKTKHTILMCLFACLIVHLGHLYPCL